MKKKGRLLTVLLTVLLSAILSAVCAALVSCAKNDGADGKNGADGIDGKNAVVDVSDDGFIVVDGNKTEYRFNQKDCKIKITRENALYGEVTGGGEYSYGTAVMLTATPNDGGVFVAWKDLNGNVIGKDKNLLAVADRGETEYTAQFACSPENVTARINVKFDETTLNNAVYTGDTETPILNGATLKFSGYGENALVLYSVDLQTFEKESAKINEDILNGKLTGGKIIAYEQFITLFNEKEFYPENTRDFYYYVAGRANNKYSVKVASSDVSGSVTLLGGGKIDADKNYLAGTVLKLKAQPKTEKLNGKTVEISDFSGWVIDGKKRLTTKNLSTR